MWDTCTFSVYSRTTDFIDESSAELAAESILRFLATRGMLRSNVPESFLAKRGMLRSKVPESVLRFLAEKGMLGWEIPEGSKTKFVKEEELINIHNKKGGILIRYHRPADFVRAGNLLAEIIDPYTTEVREKICAPTDGTLFFAHHAQLIGCGKKSVRPQTAHCFLPIMPS